MLWAQAETAATLDIAFGGIATLLDLPQKDAQDVEQVREAVKGWLAAHDDYLLILDNADTPEILPEYLPTQPAGNLLLTSRARSFGRLNIRTPLEMPVLPPDEAVTFLLERTSRTETNDAERAAASELARELGYLPLALEQAGAYIDAQQASFQNYLTSYRSHRLVLLEEHGPDTGGYEKTVAVTWSLNLESVEQESHPGGAANGRRRGTGRGDRRHFAGDGDLSPASGQDACRSFPLFADPTGHRE